MKLLVLLVLQHALAITSLVKALPMEHNHWNSHPAYQHHEDNIMQQMHEGSGESDDLLALPPSLTSYPPLSDLSLHTLNTLVDHPLPSNMQLYGNGEHLHPGGGFFPHQDHHLTDYSHLHNVPHLPYQPHVVSQQHPGLFTYPLHSSNHHHGIQAFHMYNHLTPVVSSNPTHNSLNAGMGQDEIHVSDDEASHLPPPTSKSQSTKSSQEEELEWDDDENKRPPRLNQFSWQQSQSLANLRKFYSNMIKAWGMGSKDGDKFVFHTLNHLLLTDPSPVQAIIDGHEDTIKRMAEASKPSLRYGKQRITSAPWPDRAFMNWIFSKNVRSLLTGHYAPNHPRQNRPKQGSVVDRRLAAFLPMSYKTKENQNRIIELIQRVDTSLTKEKVFSYLHYWDSNEIEPYVVQMLSQNDEEAVAAAQQVLWEAKERHSRSKKQDVESSKKQAASTSSQRARKGKKQILEESHSQQIGGQGHVQAQETTFNNQEDAPFNYQNYEQGNFQYYNPDLYEQHPFAGSFDPSSQYDYYTPGSDRD